MNHLHDPQWLPNDADMLNWLEYKTASLSRGKTGWICVLPVQQNDNAEVIGCRCVVNATLRGAIETAMREYP